MILSTVCAPAASRCTARAICHARYCAKHRRVSDIVSEIAEASREQSKGLAQINDAVANLDDVTQQNAALVEETSAASTSLQEQAQSNGANVGKVCAGAQCSFRRLRQPISPPSQYWQRWANGRCISKNAQGRVVAQRE